MRYATGEEVHLGDVVRYHGELGEIEFVVDGPSLDPEIDWFFREIGAGVMIREPKHFGRVYVNELGDGLLEFVSRPRASS
jgi:hypothetical protein